MRTVLWSGVAAAALMMGCVPTTTPDPTPFPLLAGAVEFRPFPMYRRFWAATEACTREAGDFDRIRWFYVSGWHLDPPHVPDSLRHSIGGLTWRDAAHGRLEIYLPETAVMDANLIMHEMIHALGFGPMHAHRLFVTQCHVETDDSWRRQWQPVP